MFYAESIRTLLTLKLKYRIILSWKMAILFLSVIWQSLTDGALDIKFYTPGGVKK